MDLNEDFGRHRLFMEYNEECFLEYTHSQIEVFFINECFFKNDLLPQINRFLKCHTQMFVHYNHKKSQTIILAEKF